MTGDTRSLTTSLAGFDAGGGKSSRLFILFGGTEISCQQLRFARPPLLQVGPAFWKVVYVVKGIFMVGFRAIMGWSVGLIIAIAVILLAFGVRNDSCFSPMSHI